MVHEFPPHRAEHIDCRCNLCLQVARYSATNGETPRVLSTQRGASGPAERRCFANLLNCNLGTWRDMSAVNRNNVKVLGKGTRPIMFSHGFGCDQNMWRFVAPAFKDDYKVILFDHVGAGNSDLTAFDRLKYRTLDGYAQDVLEICAELNLSELTFVGHSVSSMIGVLASIRQPERFANLVLVGPSPRYINDSSYFGGFDRPDIDGLLEMLDANYLGWASTMAPAIMGNSDRPELAEELQGSFCRTDPQIANRKILCTGDIPF
jgi:sigma-B regulation protein RsbQ